MSERSVNSKPRRVCSLQLAPSLLQLAQHPAFFDFGSCRMHLLAGLRGSRLWTAHSPLSRRKSRGPGTLFSHTPVNFSALSHQHSWRMPSLSHARGHMYRPPGTRTRAEFLELPRYPVVALLYPSRLTRPPYAWGFPISLFSGLSLSFLFLFLLHLEIVSLTRDLDRDSSSF